MIALLVNKRVSALFAVCAFFLGGCDKAGDDELTVIFAEGNGDKDQSSFLLSDTDALATKMGLVTFDAGALVRPGIAERWVISADGMNYIFRIGSYRWPDGDPITAEDIGIILRQRLRSLRNDPLAAELDAITQVIARTDEILEIELDAPRPRMLDLLAGPKLTLAHDDGGLGPMQHTSYGKDGFRLYSMIASADGDMSEQQHILTRGTSPANAVTRYQAGMADIVFGLRYDSVPLVIAADIPNDELTGDPAMGHFGLDVLSDEGLLARPLLREAIAMGIDRPRLLSAFGVPNWDEVTTLSPTQLTNRMDIVAQPWTALEMDEKRARASERIAEAGFRGAAISLFIAGDGAGTDLLFGLLRQDMAEIGLRLSRADKIANADLLLIDQVADFDDPLWYLTRLDCQRHKLCDEEADIMVNEARALRSIPDRIVLLAEAEARLTALYSYIPMAEPLRIFLSRRPVEGLEANFRALHPLQYLGSRPDQ